VNTCRPGGQADASPALAGDNGVPRPGCSRIRGLPRGGTHLTCGRRKTATQRAGASVLLQRLPMDPTKGSESGHYGALGVSTAASQRQIELTFRGWKDRHRAGAESVDAYRRAESAYHVLSVPESRARHDRQLGLVAHPAWAVGRKIAVRECTRRALRELGQGRAGQARRLLDRAVSLAPEDPHARSYLAVALARTGGCLHEAARHARYALSRRPREAAFYFNLAEVYTAAGLHAGACAFRARGWHAIVVSLVESLVKKWNASV